MIPVVSQGTAVHVAYYTVTRKLHCRCILHDHVQWWKNSNRWLFRLVHECRTILHVSSWACICPVSTLITPKADGTAISSCTNESAPRGVRLPSSCPTRPGTSRAWTNYSSGSGGSYSGFRWCSTPATTSTSCLSSLGWYWIWCWSTSSWSVIPSNKYKPTWRV